MICCLGNNTLKSPWSGSSHPGEKKRLNYIEQSGCVLNFWQFLMAHLTVSQTSYLHTVPFETGIQYHSEEFLMDP